VAATVVVAAAAVGTAAVAAVRATERLFRES